MGDDPRRSPLARALGAVLLALLAVGALWIGHEIWLEDAGRRSARLDLAEAARFARRSPSAGPLAPSHAPRRLSLPAGAEFAWTVRLSADPELRFGAIDLPEGRGAELVVDVARMSPETSSEDAARQQRIVELERCGPCTVDLGGLDHRIVRLTLRALPRGDGSPGPVEVVTPVLFGAHVQPPAPQAPGDAPPPVIVYLMDTLRADKLGAYGDDGGITPNLDAFAAEATVFENAIAQAPWTKPSVASIFTGLYARVHGIVTMSGVLPDGATTLAELMQASGYATGAVVTNGLVDAEFGFDQGFDHFERERGHAPRVLGITGFKKDKPAIDSDVAHAAVWRWLDDRLEVGATEPVFLYVHVLDPHVPHFPPEPFRSRFAAEVEDANLGSMESARALDAMASEGKLPDAATRARFEALYDAEIAHNDHQFGLFVEELQRRGIWQDALVIFVSDHGEAFWEHGQRGHGKDVFDEMLRVPFIVKSPGQTTPVRVTRLAQHVDVVPTVLDFAGVDAPPGLHGRSLRPALGGTEDDDGAAMPTLSVSHGLGATAVRAGRWKVIKRSGAYRPLELYDLERDSGETTNLADQHPIVTRFLLEEVARIEAASPRDAAPSQRDFTPEKEAELRALGYLE